MNPIKIVTILYTIFSILILLFTKNSNKWYLLILALGYPLIDLLIPPGRLGIKPFDIISFIFLIKNFNKIKFVKNNLVLYVILFALLLFIGSVLSKYLLFSLFNSFLFILYFACLFNIIFLTYRDEIEVLNKTIHIVIIWNAIFIIGQLIYGNIFTLHSTINPNMTFADEMRLSGVFQDPQKFGQFSVMTFFILIYLNSIKYKTKNIIFIIISIIFLIISASKGPFIGLSVSLIYICLRNFNLKYIFIIIVTISSFYIFRPEIENLTIVKRFDTINESAEFRLGIWNKSFDIYKEYPILGIGLKNYQSYAKENLSDQYWDTESGPIYYDNPESGVLLLLVEIGTLGVFSILLGLFYLIKNSFKYSKVEYLEAAIISWVIGMVSVYSLSDKKIGFIILTIISLLYMRKHTNFIRLTSEKQ